MDASERLPFLNMGATLARNQDEGISPVSKDFLKINSQSRGYSSAATLSILAGMPSMPVALCGFRSESNLVTPETEIVILEMMGTDLGGKFGRVSSWVKLI